MMNLHRFLAQWILPTRRSTQPLARRATPVARLRLEDLEDGTLMSINVTGDGTFLLRSDPTNVNAQVFLNGVLQDSQPWSAVGNVNITTLNGNDTVNIENVVVPATVNVNLGKGNDTVFLSPTAHQISNIENNVVLHGGTGFDLLNVADQSNTFDSTWSLLADSVRGGGSGLISYDVNFSHVGIVGIVGGSGNNVYSVNDVGSSTVLTPGNGNDTVNIMAARSAVTVLGSGRGKDVVNVGDGGSLAGLLAALTLDNPTSFSHVNINDAADTTNHPNVVLSAHSLTGLTPSAINFGANAVASLTIQGGSGTNTYTVSGTPGSTNNTLNAGAGTDAVNVLGTGKPLTVNSADGSGADVITLGDAANTLNGITAAVTVNAAPTDTLTLDDQDTAAARTYTVTATAVSWTGAAGVSYTGVGALNLNGSSGDDTFVLTSSSATAVLSITGGAGNNMAVGSDAGNFWDLMGSNSGFLFSSAYANTVFFANVANLTSGTGGDTYFFNDGASISGNLTGGGADTLDYTPYTTSVVVDLALAAAGTDTGVGGTVSGVVAIVGGSGVPAGPGVFNLLISAGGDFLQGGIGRRNLLVAGGSASTLVGGDGEDLLIAGSTAYDTDPALANWQALAAYWAGSDPFATRVSNLLSGTGVPILDPTAGTGTVFGNGGGNVLSGNGALALIFTDGLDAISGFDPNAQQVTITP